MDAGWGSAISGVLGLIQTGINNRQQNSTNNRNFIFAAQQAEQQRKWALEDWDRNNKYNSPAQQMQRFKEAGLNPNLIYGQSNTAAPVRSTEPAHATAVAPRIDLSSVGESIQMYQNLKTQQVQTDNMLAQRRLIEANTLQALANTDLKNFQTERSKALFQADLDAATERVRKLYYEADLANARTTFTMEDNERLNQRQPLVLQKLGTEIAINEAREKNERLTSDKIREQTALLAKQIDLTELNKISKRQQNAMWEDVQQNILKKNLLLDAQKGNVKAQQELNEIKARWRAGGVSETVISDFLKVLESVILRKR